MATVLPLAAALRLPAFPGAPRPDNVAAITAAFGESFLDSVGRIQLSREVEQVLLYPSPYHRLLLAAGFAEEVGREALRPLTGGVELGQFISGTILNFEEIKTGVLQVHKLLTEPQPSSVLSEIGHELGKVAAGLLADELKDPNRLAKRLGQLSAQAMITIVITIVTLGAGAAVRAGSLVQEYGWAMRMAKKFAPRFMTRRGERTLRRALRPQRMVKNRATGAADRGLAPAAKVTTAPAKAPAGATPPPASSGGKGKPPGAKPPRAGNLILAIRRRLIKSISYDEFRALELSPKRWATILEKAQRNVAAFDKGGNSRSAAVHALKGIVLESLVVKTPEYLNALKWARKLAGELGYDPKSVRFTMDVQDIVIGSREKRAFGDLTDGVIYARKDDSYLILSVFESKAANFNKLVKESGSTVGGQIERSLARLETGAVYIEGARVEPGQIVQIADYPVPRLKAARQRLGAPVNLSWFGVVPKKLLKPGELRGLLKRLRAQGRKIEIIEGPLTNATAQTVAETILSELSRK